MMVSRFGCRAEIPILPIFYLVPPSRSPSKTSFFSKSPSHRRRMEHEVDGWIEQLTQCKQLAEADVKTLCDRVRIPPHTRTTVSYVPLFSLYLFTSRFPHPGQRNLDGGVKCAAGKMSGDSLWRYPRSIRAFHPCSCTNPQQLTS